jgi:hypothetical protein
MPGIAFVVIGIVAGLGMLFVQPAAGEPEQLDRLFPLARLYRYRAVRVVMAVAFFGFALLGLALMLGWL